MAVRAVGLVLVWLLAAIAIPHLAISPIAISPIAISEARAASSAVIGGEGGSASLISDVDTVAPGQPFHVGLLLRLAPGWHTYWRNPGDAGAPPEFDLRLPAGSKSGPIAWPAPQRLQEGPLLSYAYTGDVLLAVAVQPAAVTGPYTLRAHAAWLVCEHVCIPREAELSLTLPQGPAPVPAAQAPLFADAASRTPSPSPWTAHISPDGTLSLAGEELSPSRIADAWFFPERGGPIDPEAAEPVTIDDGSLRLGLHRGPGFDPAADLTGVLVLHDPTGTASYWQVAATPGATPPRHVLPMSRLLALAFAGGLILNLMPCVFPVLALKAIALVELAGAAPRRVRAQAISYTAGVLVTFAALAGVMLSLRGAGYAAGWGFQFQSPVFVAGMSWLLFGVGLALSGVVHVGSRLAGSGQRLAASDGHRGSFFTGLLAVLVATPCTAPFMGVAVAAALAAPALTTVAIFLAMGCGLAAPYAAFAAWPALATLLPRPGRWMEVVKQGLAFPMYAAAAWMLWVVSQEAGADGVLATAAGLVLIGFAAWALRTGAASAPQHRRFAHAAALAAGLAALAVLPGIAAAPSAPAEAAGTEPFSPARLAALRQEGRPVFVDFTAAWCVTCLVNERLALAQAPVRQAFAAHGVAFLRGDWTRQDPAITAFLRAHGRDGVPLYLYYPGGDLPPETLPQILTASDLISVVDSVHG